MIITIRSDEPIFYEVLAMIQRPPEKVADNEETVIEMTQDQLRAFCSEAIKEGKQPQLKEILNSLNVKNLTELEQKDYDKVVKALLKS